MPNKIMTPEAAQVAKEIFDKFYQWANERMADYEELGRGSDVSVAKVSVLIFAQRNLLKIVRDVTGMEK